MIRLLDIYTTPVTIDGDNLDPNALPPFTETVLFYVLILVCISLLLFFSFWVIRKTKRAENNA